MSLLETGIGNNVSETFYEASSAPHASSQKEQRLPDINDKKIYYRLYYDEKIDEIKTFFQARHYDVALAAFELLLDKKAGKLRRDRETPDEGHEIDQILPIIRSMENGYLDIKAIEQRHGSLEKWFCCIATHDIPEDSGLFAEDIIKDLKDRILKKTGIVSEYNKNMIAYTMRGAEVLTHYRKFSVDQFSGFIKNDRDLDILQDIKALETGDIIDLSAYKNLFWKKMNIVPGLDRENLQVFARKDDGKKPVVIVTRYGGSPEGTPESETYYSPEWPTYIHTAVEYDIYVAMTKMGDRTQGMATRIGMLHTPGKIKSDLESYNRYLCATRYIFETINPAKRLTEKLHPGTPLTDCINSISQMTGLLGMMGESCVLYHPERNGNGLRGWGVSSVFNLPAILVDATRFPKANNFFKDVDWQSHYMATFMRQLKDSSDPGMKKIQLPVHGRLEKDLVKQYPELKIKLISERDDPFPSQTWNTNGLLKQTLEELSHERY